MSWFGTVAGKATIGGVLLAVAVALATYNWPRAHPLKGSVPMVCVTSGKVYYLSRGGFSRIPAKNPETGQETLVPAYEQDGAWHVVSRAREAVKMLGEANKTVDPNSLIVNVAK